MNRLALRSSFSTIRAGLRQLGAGLGLASASQRATVRSPISDFSPVLWGGRRLTPDQVRWTLESAVSGNLQSQWDLIDLMEDTWPRLVKNLNEIRQPAARTTYTVQPYAARGEVPSAAAVVKADMVTAALRGWLPRPGTLELSFEDTLYDALDAYGKGISVLEVTWRGSPDGMLPRCAHLVSPRRYGWNREGTELGLTNPQSAIRTPQSAAWEPFPAGQFLVGAWRSRSGVPGQTALLRCLAPYWVGITFGWEWLLSTAQIFGVPFRWATYDTNHPEVGAQLAGMLENLGSAGWAAFPAGTQLEFKDAVQRASDNPQLLVQSLADKACDLLILGQELSGGAQAAGLGGGAAGLQGDVRRERIQIAAQWCADLLNYQLVPAVVQFNFGDTAELPTIVPDLTGKPDPKTLAERDQVLLASGAKLPLRWYYERHSVPVPQGDEAVITAPAAAPAPAYPFPGPVTDRGVKSAAPGGMGSPESAAAAPLAARASSGPAADLTPLLRAAAADLAPARARIEAIIRLAEAGKDDAALSAIAALQSDFPQLTGSAQLTTALDSAMGAAALAGAQDVFGKTK